MANEMATPPMKVDPLLNLGLLSHLTAGYAKLPVSMTRDDFFQEGYFGLDRACRKFDPSRGVKFSVYAKPWIRQSCLIAVKTKGSFLSGKDGKRKTVGEILSRERPTLESEFDLPFSHFIPMPEDRRDLADFGISAAAILDRSRSLSPTHPKILRLRYGLNKQAKTEQSWAEIAERLKITADDAERMHDEAIAFLRKTYAHKLPKEVAA